MRKKTPGGAGTHARDTRAQRTRAHGSHRRTSQPSKPNDTPARPVHMYQCCHVHNTPSRKQSAPRTRAREGQHSGTIIHITPPTYVYSQLTTSRHIRIWGGSVRVVTRRSGNVYALFTQSRRHSETHRYPAHRPDIRFSTHPIQRFNNRQPTLHSLRLIEEWAEELGNGQ